VSGPIVCVRPVVREFLAETGPVRLTKWDVLARRDDGKRELFFACDTWDEAKLTVERRLTQFKGRVCLTRPIYRVGPREYVTEYTPVRVRAREFVSVATDWSITARWRRSECRTPPTTNGPRPPGRGPRRFAGRVTPSPR